MLHLTREQLREIDRRALADYHIPGIVLMENAARAVAEQACHMLDGECCCSVLILCGSGNNGGDGLAAARHLHNVGAQVTIAFTVDPARYRGDARVNYDITQAMQISSHAFDVAMLREIQPMLIIDAIFGTGLDQPPRDPFSKIADLINRTGIQVLAVDLPSGLDCNTGIPPGACIRANCTVTFVAEKSGFSNPAARRFLGEVIVGDIGCPRELVNQIAAESI